MRQRFRAGALRERATLHNISTTLDAYGGQDETWEHGPTFWAMLEPIGFAEAFQRGKIRQDGSHRIVCRYRTDVANNDRLVIDGVGYHVQTVTDLEHRHRYLEIIVEALAGWP